MSPLWLAIRSDLARRSMPRPSMPSGALSEGLRQEVKPYNIHTTVISPGAMVTELPSSVTEPDVAERVRKHHEEFGILPTHFARAVAFAISQPEEMDVSEIVFRGMPRNIRLDAKALSQRLWLAKEVGSRRGIVAGASAAVANSAEQALTVMDAGWLMVS